MDVKLNRVLEIESMDKTMKRAAYAIRWHRWRLSAMRCAVALTLKRGLDAIDDLYGNIICAGIGLFHPHEFFLLQL